MAQDPIKDGEIAGDDKDEEEIDGDLYVVLALLGDGVEAEAAKW